MNKKMKWIFLAKVLTVARLHLKKQTQTWGVRVGSKRVYPLSYLATPIHFFFLRDLPKLR